MAGTVGKIVGCKATEAESSLTLGNK